MLFELSIEFVTQKLQRVHPYCTTSFVALFSAGSYLFSSYVPHSLYRLSRSSPFTKATGEKQPFIESCCGLVAPFFYIFGTVLVAVLVVVVVVVVVVAVRRRKRRRRRYINECTSRTRSPLTLT
jgi:hypothetical protein